MHVPDDDIARIEGEGVRRTSIDDWAGARASFQEALQHEMSPFRRASILRNVAAAYAKEKNADGVRASVRQALDVLDRGDASGADVLQLRSDLKTIAALWGGQLPLTPFKYAIAFAAGIYWGMSVSAGTLLVVHVEGYRFGLLDTWLVPPLACLLVGFLYGGVLNRIAMIIGVTLYVMYLFGFGLGIGVAGSGLM